MAIEVTVEPDRIVVRLTGPSVVAAMRRTVEIPIEAVESVTVVPRREVRWGAAWLRLPGTHVPGLIRYGSYGIGSSREFWAVKRQPEVVVVEATAGPYRRVVLGVEDPHRVAGAIGAARRT